MPPRPLSPGDASLHPGSGGRWWGQHGAPPAPSRILAPKTYIQRRSCLQRRVFVHRQVSLLVRSVCLSPVRPFRLSHPPGGKRPVLDAVCWGEDTRLCGTELSATSHNMIFVVFYAHIFSFITGLYRVRFCWYCFVFIFLAILYN